MPVNILSSSLLNDILRIQILFAWKASTKLTSMHVHYNFIRPSLIHPSLLLTEHIKHYFQDICIPIHGPCSTGSAPDFYINGLLTSWPESGQLYNITLHSQTYHFCFRNITEDIIITEYCLQGHIAGCSLCSFRDGERVFQSRSEIFKLIPGN